jgi:F420-dependent oxidoreductase-like protein
MDMILHAEKLGFDSVWTAEAYGNDAVTAATWIGAKTERIKVGTAIMQMPARTPAMAAMTAISLDQLTGGRFILGLGPSGPQVVEGWHGVPYGKPLTRTKEYIQIIRKILAREEPLSFEGELYHIPASGPGTSGLGKPLKSILHGNPAMPIYTASIGPAGLRCAGEVADGVFPMMMNPERFDQLQRPYLEEGFAKATRPMSLANFAVCPGVSVVISDDREKARMPIKAGLALYIGGMGARDKNFYNDYVTELGYGAAARTIQDLYLAGKKEEAAAAVPDRLVDEIALVGSRDRIRREVQRWVEAGKKKHVGSMLLGTMQVEAMQLMAELLL